MRPARVIALFLLSSAPLLRADLTIIQAVQPLEKGEAVEPGHEMVLYLAGEKLRLDSGEVSSIVRKDAGKTYSLMHPHKRYVTLPHLARPRAAQQAAVAPVHATATGKTDRINGFSCYQVRAQQEDGTKMEAWISKDAEARRALDSVSRWQTGPYADLVSGMGFRAFEAGDGTLGFPIKSTVLDEQGKPTIVVEVKRVDNRPIKADVFEPPPGYEEMKLDAKP